MPRRALLAAAALVLPACGTAPPSPAPTKAPSAAVPPAAGRLSPLETERRWLQSWFKDTPVVIELNDDGVLAVEVPRAFCFDAGRSVIKPPLAAVLDKVAESLRRQQQARLTLAAAPGDAGKAEIAVARAAQLRQHLRSRGVPEARIAAPSRSAADAVQLRLQLGSAAP